MFLSKLVKVEQALKTMGENLKITDTEVISLEDAYKRVLAVDIISQLDSPPFSRSAMDGYAVKAQDTFGSSPNNPAHLTMVDEIGAGNISHAVVEEGQAVKIATGAPLPHGADAVIMNEYVQEKAYELQVESSLTPGENVSFQGEDIKKGELIIKRDKLLQPQDLAIIASGGYSKVTVYRKPQIAVLVTGSELVMPNPDIKGAEVINSNHYTLKGLVESSLAVPTLNHVEDHANKVKNEIERLLITHDAIITTGGTAISKGDVVVEVVEQLGEVLFHGVSMRPGKPLAFGMVNGSPIFMLSGYPVAAMVQYDIMVRKNIEKMQKIHKPSCTVKKTASRKVPSTLGRTDYVRARTDGDEVIPLNIKGSTIIRSMVDSNCYIVIEENLEGVAEGEKCDVLLYDALRV